MDEIDVLGTPRIEVTEDQILNIADATREVCEIERKITLDEIPWLLKTKGDIGLTRNLPLGQIIPFDQNMLKIQGNKKELTEEITDEEKENLHYFSLEEYKPQNNGKLLEECWKEIFLKIAEELEFDDIKIVYIYQGAVFPVLLLPNFTNKVEFINGLCPGLYFNGSYLSAIMVYQHTEEELEEEESLVWEDVTEKENFSIIKSSLGLTKNYTINKNCFWTDGQNYYYSDGYDGNANTGFAGQFYYDSIENKWKKKIWNLQQTYWTAIDRKQLISDKDHNVEYTLNGRYIWNCHGQIYYSCQEKQFRLEENEMGTLWWSPPAENENFWGEDIKNLTFLGYFLGLPFAILKLDDDTPSFLCVYDKVQNNYVWINTGLEFPQGQRFWEYGDNLYYFEDLSNGDIFILKKENENYTWEKVNGDWSIFYRDYYYSSPYLGFWNYNNNLYYTFSDVENNDTYKFNGNNWEIVPSLKNSDINNFDHNNLWEYEGIIYYSNSDQKGQYYLDEENLTWVKKIWPGEYNNPMDIFYIGNELYADNGYPYNAQKIYKLYKKHLNKINYWNVGSVGFDGRETSNLQIHLKGEKELQYLNAEPAFYLTDSNCNLTMICSKKDMKNYFDGYILNIYIHNNYNSNSYPNLTENNDFSISSSAGIIICKGTNKENYNVPVIIKMTENTLRYSSNEAVIGFHNLRNIYNSNQYKINLKGDCSDFNHSIGIELQNLISNAYLDGSKLFPITCRDFCIENIYFYYNSENSDSDKYYSIPEIYSKPYYFPFEHNFIIIGDKKFMWFKNLLFFERGEQN